MSNSTRLIVALIFVVIAAFAASLGRMTPPVALTGADGWIESGHFPTLGDKPPVLQVPATMSGDVAFRMFRTWTEHGALKGAIISPRFKPSHYMAFPFQRGGPRGYPNSDLHYLRCLETGETYTISSAQTFDEWSVAYVNLPHSFCSGDVVMVATSNGANQFAFLSVATPFEISRAMYFAQAGVGARSLVVLLTWALFSLIALSAAIMATYAKPQIEPLPAGIIGIGLAAMIVLTAGMITSSLARDVSVALPAAAAVVVLAQFISDRQRTSAIWRQISGPLLLWLAIGTCLFLFVAGIENGAGRWTANTMFSPLSWSTDNENPINFAYTFAHAARGELLTAGPWYFDDRTPILTALMIIPQTLFIEPAAKFIGSDFIYSADSGVGVLMLSLWAPALLWVGRLIMVRRRTLFFAIVAISPFMIFNTVYTWAKILGAAYIALAIGLMLCARDDGDRPNLALIPSALALAYLAHAGNGISSIAFLIVFSSTLRTRDIRVLAHGVVGAALLMAPWEYWTIFVQPHGNALMRYQLADDTGFNHRSMSVVVSTVEHLSSVGWTYWFDLKARSFALIADVAGVVHMPVPMENHTPDFIANQRASDFDAVARAIGIAWLGVICIIVHWVRRAKTDPLAVRLAFCGMIGIASLTLLITQLGIVHHQAYGSVMMLAMAGAMYFADRRSRLPVIVFFVWLAYFIVTWIVSPLTNADHLHPLALVLSFLWLVCAVMIVVHDACPATDHTYLWRDRTHSRRDGTTFSV